MFRELRFLFDPLGARGVVDFMQQYFPQLRIKYPNACITFREAPPGFPSKLYFINSQGTETILDLSDQSAAAINEYINKKI